MKVVHICTHDTGGAAEAAYRLHAAMVSMGIDSRFLVLFNSGRYSDVITYSQSRKTFILKKIKRRIHSPEKIIHAELSVNKRIEIFSLNDTIYDVASHPLIKDCDIVHLHWIGGFVDTRTFFRTLKKKIVWTFHDENPLLGSFHYSLDLQWASRRLQQMEKEFLRKKRRDLQGADIHVVAPSKWLYDKAMASGIPAFKNVHLIQYGINQKEFSLLDKVEARKALGLQVDKTYFLAVASDLNIYRKGFDLLPETFDEFGIDFATLLIVGKLEMPLNNKGMQYVGFIRDKSVLNKFYNAVDATIIPSRADNLPNVMIESLLCGCPVLGFAVGGIQEIINNTENGRLSNDISSKGLHDLTRYFHLNKSDFSDKNKIREQAIALFDDHVQASKLVSLYRSI